MMTANVSLARVSKDPCDGFSRAGELTGEDLGLVVNKDPGHMLQPDWHADDLEVIPKAYLSAQRRGRVLRLRQEALKAYTEMQTAAQKQKIRFYIVSAYRSFQEQCYIFNRSITRWSKHFRDPAKGLDYTQRTSAEPGRSQHQLGTAVDLVFASYGDSFTFKMESTAEYSWLKENAHRYGFVLSYPRGDDHGKDSDFNSVTGYNFEPWHWRYVGIELAQQIRTLGVSPDEFLLSLPLEI